MRHPFAGMALPINGAGYACDVVDANTNSADKSMTAIPRRHRRENLRFTSRQCSCEDIAMFYEGNRSGWVVGRREGCLSVLVGIPSGSTTQSEPLTAIPASAGTQAFRGVGTEEATADLHDCREPGYVVRCPGTHPGQQAGLGQRAIGRHLSPIQTYAPTQQLPSLWG